MKKPPQAAKPERCTVGLGKLVPALLRARPNRFLAVVQLGRTAVEAHVPNTGRLNYALAPGTKVWLRKAGQPRRTRYDLVLAETAGGRLVVDSAVQNRLVERALTCGQIPEFSGYRTCQREVAVGRVRLDFLLCNQNQTCFLEVKGATLVEEGCAKYPDAPTERGARHLEALMGLAKKGLRTAILFVALSEHAARFSPNVAVDPGFSSKLKQACLAGVEVYAYRVLLGEDWARLGQKIPVLL